jgi:hypothetical protein
MRPSRDKPGGDHIAEGAKQGELQHGTDQGPLPDPQQVGVKHALSRDGC